MSDAVKKALCIVVIRNVDDRIVEAYDLEDEREISIRSVPDKICVIVVEI